jgi:hypothetical protein
MPAEAALSREQTEPPVLERTYPARRDWAPIEVAQGFDVSSGELREKARLWSGEGVSIALLRALIGSPRRLASERTGPTPTTTCSDLISLFINDLYLISYPGRVSKGG